MTGLEGLASGRAARRHGRTDELLERFHAGDAAAFAVLLRATSGPIYNFIAAHRSAITEAAADLLAGSVHARASSGRATSIAASKFSTWLYAIARNHCIDHLRRMKHRRHASLDARAGRGESRRRQRLGRAHRAAISPTYGTRRPPGGLRSRIAAAVESLPDEQREVFLMREVQQMPFAEIALVVGVSENTIKSRMRYALERLQEALAEYEEYARAQV